MQYSGEILDSIREGVILLDSHLQILYWNRWIEEYTRRDFLGLKGEPLVKVFPPFLPFQEILKDLPKEGPTGLPIGDYLSSLHGSQEITIKALPDGHVLLHIYPFYEEGVRPSFPGEKERDYQKSTFERKRGDALSFDREEGFPVEFRSLVDHLPGVIYLCRNDTRYSMFYISDKVESLTGYPKEDFLTDTISFTQLYHPEDSARIYREVDAALKEKRPYRLTYRLQDSQGKYKWVEEFGAGIFNEEDQLIYLEGFLSDITNQHKMKETLKERDERLQSIFHTVKDVAFIMVDFKENSSSIQEFSPSAEAIFGYQKEEVLGEPSQLLYQEPKGWNTQRIKERLEEKKEGFSQEVIFRKKNGTSFIGYVAFSPLFSREGQLRGVLAVIIDVTQQRKIQQKMKSLNERLELATRSAGIGIWDWDLQENKLYWDERMYQLYGMKKEEFSSAYEAWLSGLYPEDQKRSHEEIKKAIIGEKDFDTHFRVILPHGEIRYLKANGEIIRDKDNRPIRMIGTNYDITDRILGEEALVEGEKRYRTLFNDSPYGILLIDPVTKEAKEFNEAACQQLGYTREEFSKLSIRDYEIKETEEETKGKIKRLQEGYREEFETKHRHKSGAILDVFVTARIINLQDGDVILALFRDITQQKKAEERIKEGEEQLRSIFEAATNISFVITDLQGSESKIKEFSPGSEKIFGYKREEMLGQKVKILHLEEDARTFPNLLNELMEKKEGHSREMTLRRKSKEEFPALLTVYPLFDAQGNVKGTLGVTIDLSEQKKMEEALLNSEKRYRGLVETQHDLIVRVNMQNQFTYVNEAYCRTFGKKREDLLGKSFAPLVHEDDIEETLRAMNGLKQHPYRVQFEQRALTIRGFRWIHWEDSAILDSKGKIVEIQGVGRDITTIKKAQDDLRESEERYRSLVEQALDGILITDRDLQFLQINSSGSEILGYPLDELKNMNLEDLFLQEERIELKKAYEILSRGESLKNEWKLRKKGGALVEVEVYARMLTNDTILAIIRDITERKIVEKSIQVYTTEMELKNMELEQARNQALEASRAKSTFLSTMSHEIRTPMNSIIGMAELLADTPLDETQSEYVRIFRNAGDNLLSLINDILDLSKIEAGYVKLEEEPFHLTDTVEKIIDLLKMRSSEKEIELLLFISPDVPTQLIGDSSRLRQILVNLLGNAIKFTHEGEVFLSIDFYSQEKKNDKTFVELIFSVRDTGIGIPADKQEEIFSSFTQVDSSRTRKYGGTGLGLAISKQLVEMMGGSIRVESMEDMGSIFSFTATFRLNEEKPFSLQLETSELNLKGMRILLLDDNSTNLMILREMLSGEGAIINTITSGKKAIQELNQAFQEGNPYHLLLLDFMMPEMDGFQVICELKEKGLGENLGMILFSSDLWDEEKQRTKNLLVDGFLEKPIRRKDLFRVLTEVMGTKVPVSLPRRDDKEKMKGDEILHKALEILLVEDSQDNRLLLQAYLKSTPYQLTMKENGSLGLKAFKERPFDLVFMDIQMPVMDGYTAIQKIRKWEEEQCLSRTPVIALTAHALKEDIKKSLKQGFDAHLAKPIKKKDLLEAIVIYGKKG